MADITMCTNKTCHLKDKCYRQTASPSSYQSYAEFEPDAHGCEHFYKRETRKPSYVEAK